MNNPLPSICQWRDERAVSGLAPLLLTLAWLAFLLYLAGCTAGTVCDSVNGPSCLTCPAGTADCNLNPDDGCEVNTTLDSGHCGSCDKACPGVSRHLALCIGGVCGECPNGRLDCNGVSEDGCEVRISSDAQNCGGCGIACPAVPNGIPGCADGNCDIGRCMLGFQDCNGDPADGCEIDTRADPQNCGNCGATCPTLSGGAVACRNGTCVVPMCNPGFGSCNPNSPVAACETNLNTDEYNCGNCGVPCPPVSMMARACMMGMCSSRACDSRWQNCNGTTADGCEADTQRDLQHCGGCNQPCAAAAGSHATVTCQQGRCVLLACDPGFGDCNGNVGDGCETQLSTSVNNCGACNTRCVLTAGAMTVGCSNSHCTITQCQNNLRDCDGLYNTGCEVNITNDEMNCGVCDSACDIRPNSIPVCAGSRCTYPQPCEPNYGNCDGNSNNGCESALLLDLRNCGQCGFACPAGQFCNDGKCML